MQPTTVEELVTKRDAVDAAYKAYAASAVFKACFESDEYKAFQAACVAYDNARNASTVENVFEALKAS